MIERENIKKILYNLLIDKNVEKALDLIEKEEKKDLVIPGDLLLESGMMAFKNKEWECTKKLGDAIMKGELPDRCCICNHRDSLQFDTSYIEEIYCKDGKVIRNPPIIEDGMERMSALKQVVARCRYCNGYSKTIVQIQGNRYDIL